MSVWFVYREDSDTINAGPFDSYVEAVAYCDGFDDLYVAGPIDDERSQQGVGDA